MDNPKIMMPKDKEVYDQPLEILHLSSRAANPLLRTGLRTVGDIILTGEIKISLLPGVGKNSLREIIDALASIGVSLPKEGMMQELYMEVAEEEYYDILGGKSFMIKKNCELYTIEKN